MDLLIILGIILIPIIAQIYISSNYANYSKIENKKNITGFEVARKILDKNGLDKIHIVEVKGNLTDHYDPTYKVVRLSTSIFHGSSIAALSVAAHECGHAIQDKDNYSFLRFRSLIFPVVHFTSYFAYIILFIGLLSEALNLFALGIALVSIGLLFQIVTLPVEFNASSRAKKELEKLKLVTKTEAQGVEKMLNSAAFTYVAGVLSSILELLRLILIFTNRRD